MAGRKPGVKFGGRKKGTPNKHKKEHRESLREFCARIGVDPHRYMAEMILDQRLTPELRFQAAKELAQYLQPRLKAVEHSGEVEHAVRIIQVTLE